MRKQQVMEVCSSLAMQLRIGGISSPERSCFIEEGWRDRLKQKDSQARERTLVGRTSLSIHDGEGSPTVLERSFAIQNYGNVTVPFGPDWDVTSIVLLTFRKSLASMVTLPPGPLTAVLFT